MEATEVSIDRQMDKEDAHICKGVLLGHNEECNLAICNNIDGPRRYAKCSKSDIKKKCWIILLTMCNLQTKQKQTQIQETNWWLLGGGYWGMGEIGEGD